MVSTYPLAEFWTRHLGQIAGNDFWMFLSLQLQLFILLSKSNPEKCVSEADQEIGWGRLKQKDLSVNKPISRVELEGDTDEVPPNPFLCVSQVL